MTRNRSYRDPCGIARALDLVGERWALLVVRELLLGPKRFGQLRAGLGEISPNVLSQRLRELEEAGVVVRERLGPPIGAMVYRLSERGAALEPVLVELGRWGGGTPMPEDAARVELGVDALVIALRSLFDPARAEGISLTGQLRVADDVFRLRVDAGRFTVTRGTADRPDVTIETDPGTLRSVLFGRVALADATASGDLTVHGDHAAAQRLTTLFPPPSGHAR